ncbi:hypothetical protein FOZ63_018403, partial [Perkinsus olseni]
MALLAHICQYPDKAFVDQLRRHGGVPFVGHLTAGGALFAPVERKERPTISLTELAKRSSKRLSWFTTHPPSSSQREHWATLWDMALSEVSQGRLEGPFSLDYLSSLSEPPGVTLRHLVVTSTKQRPVDDYRRSHINAATSVGHKVTLPEVSTILSAMRELWLTLPPASIAQADSGIEGLRIYKLDHRDAYRQ